jgi:uncharacterized protein (TIGR00369 family)
MTAPTYPGRAGIHAFRDSDQHAAMRNDISPYMEALAMHIVSIDAQAGRLRAAFDAGAHYVGVDRSAVHGGAIAAMLDTSMASLVVAMTGASQTTATANLNVSYLRRLPAGPCTCEVETDRVGRTLAFIHAVLLDAAGARVATASGTFAILAAAEGRP